MLAHFLDKKGIIDGIETNHINVTQCGTNTINLKDGSWWQQLQFFTFFCRQETRQEKSRVSSQQDSVEHRLL